MKYAATSATLAAAIIGLATAQSQTPTVTTPPSLVECQPAQFTVSGGTAPYFLSILPGGQTGSAPLETLPTVDAAGTVTWDVDIPSGTSITIQVRDASGSLNYSQQVTIQPGTSTSCIGANSSLGGSSATQSSTNTSGARSTASGSQVSSASSAFSSSVSRVSSSASAASSSAPASSSAAQSSQQQPSSTPAESSAAPSASASNSGANAVFAQTGLLGAAAAAIMALIA